MENDALAKLVCTACGREHPFETIDPRCRDCGEPLEVRLAGLGHARIRTGRRDMFSRYADFLPFARGGPRVSLGEGGTPLTPWRDPPVPFDGIRLFFKNETLNPTWSFKDRGTATGIRHALRLGYDRVGTVSTGNMAPSVAAYAANRGLKAFIFVSRGLPAEKIAPIAVYRPALVVVDGDYGRLYDKSIELGTAHGVYFINSDVPLRVEGSKTIAFEICEQMTFDVPEYVVVPTSAGGNVRGIIKGFEEFKAAGLIDKMPTVIAAQASGCAPIARAWASGKTTVGCIQAPETLAHAIENPCPPSGNQVLRKLARYRGRAVHVSDESIVRAQATMARMGIFGQPAAAVPLAAVRKLLAAGQIPEGSRVVCIVTGSGLKYPRALDQHLLPVTRLPLDRLSDIFLETHSKSHRLWQQIEKPGGN